VSTFHLHRSNRVESLVDALASALRAPLGTPFSPEPVVVQGRGMSVWLSHALSRRLGVWAGAMPYPRHFIEAITEIALGKGTLGAHPVSEDLLEWAIQASLDDLLPDPAFAPLARYVQGDDRGLRRAQLARRVATVFDQYLLYRPEWIRDWEQERPEHVPAQHLWQPPLWRAVAHRLGGTHIAHVERRLIDRLAGSDPPSGLPPRVSLFGLSTLPPLYVRVLAALSSHVDVHLYLYSPRPGPWPAPEDGPTRRLAAAHPLLASLGFLGADFDAVLREELARAGVTPVLHEHHVAPVPTSVLGRLQADIHDGIDPASAPRLPLPDAPDPSFAVHSCHGPLREVEVLHDQILDLVARPHDPVAPEDIVVLCPDLETYAPLVDAVFARPYGTRRFLPYHVSDRSGRGDAPVIDALERVLAMAGGRVTATEVMDLLLLDAVRKRFGLEASEVDAIQTWVAASGARWGIDGAHRERHGVPGAIDFTWEFGFRRLLLGYAMRMDGSGAFEGIVPFDDIEGHDARALGCFVRFARTLFDILQTLEEPRSLPGWAAAIAELSEGLFSGDRGTLEPLARVRRALEEVIASAEAAGFTGTVSLAVVRDVIARKVDASQQARGFLAGGVTFCGMVPMRSIPFRVVCLLGMNDGAFPRSPRPIEFDAVRGARQRRAGDRSPRDDDRYLLLETLGAARERLLVTYTGRGVRDNRERPPSVCLGELLDALVAGHDVPGSDPEDEAKRREAVRARLVVQHRLQGFDPAYFEASEERDPRLFSYSKEYREAAHALGQVRRDPDVFLECTVRTEVPELLRLDDLVRFFRSPAAYFLNRRLGVYLKDYDIELGDREVLELGNLERWAIGDARVRHALRQLDADASEALLRGTGALPLGAPGHLQFRKINEAASAIATEVHRLRAGEPLEPLTLAVKLAAGTTVVGTVGSRFPGGRVEHAYSKMGPKGFVCAWIRHVAACAQGDERPGAYVARDKPVTCRRWKGLPRDAALEVLGALVDLYVQGQAAPLPFCLNASADYIARGDSISAAVNAYDGEFGDTAYDPHFERAFAPLVPPFDALYDAGKRPLEETAFHHAAHRVFDPIARWQDDGADVDVDGEAEATPASGKKKTARRTGGRA
jgi:exodeoxyribonuclease V gamma subunit